MLPVYLDTMVSPSYTTAIAQALQLPSVSGKDINMALFEYAKDDTQSLDHILENIPLIEAAEFDSCILSSCDKGFGINKEIHIWIKTTDYNNANLMILLGYVIRPSMHVKIPASLRLCYYTNYFADFL